MVADNGSTVLDLPQLYQRPFYDVLLATLSDLSLTPLSWETPQGPDSSTPSSTGARVRPKVSPQGIPAYLTSIISSPLHWLDNDEQREHVWETASQRLSERSGRSGRGALTRTFTIPCAPKSNNAEAPDKPDHDDMVEITLHEPALTADNLGLKTWAAAYLLAKRLLTLQASLPSTVTKGEGQILELGAGTGLVGIAAAAVLGAHVVLTDLPAIAPNLERNIAANAAMLEERGGRAEAAVLDWTKPEDFTLSSGGTRVRAHSFGLVLVADPIYSASHPTLLVNAIDAHLSRDEGARVVVELPLREAYSPEIAELRNRMGRLGLKVLEEGEETGVDDWSEGSDEGRLTEVRCWWSVWGWG